MGKRIFLSLLICLICNVCCIYQVNADASQSCESGATDKDKCNCPGWGFQAVTGCVECTSNKYNDGKTSDITQCKDCINKDSIPPDANVIDHTQQICPWELICKTDEYYDSNSMKCVECEDQSNLTYKPNNLEYIINNNTRDFSNGSITARCECRERGYTLSENGCNPIQNITCSASKYLKANNATCDTQCPAGSYCPGNATYTFSSSNNQGITICPAGYYCPAESSSPSPCPAGSITLQAGATSIKECYMDSNTKFYDANHQGDNYIPFTTIFGTTPIKFDL